MNEFDPLTFKFRWMDEGNVTGGMFSLSASFDGKNLTLDEEILPVKSIVSSAVYENVLSLSVDVEGEWQDFTFAVIGEQAATVKRAIDGARSTIEVAEEHKRLIAEGQGSSFRSETCPHCNATISLSKFADSPQCYCQYCETLFTIRDQYRSHELDSKTLAQNLETKYGLCDHCGMYSFPRQFRIFYFVFLVYFMHFASEKTVRCPACMRWEAWKMFCGNIFGLLGLPVAIMALYRSYKGRVEKGPLKGLDDANSLANRGKIDRALDRYDQLMDNQPINAGIKFNIATGLVNQGDIPHAETMFLLSLEDCSNYEPSLQGLHFCYQSLGKSKELKDLEFQMGFAGYTELDAIERELLDETAS